MKDSTFDAIFNMYDNNNNMSTLAALYGVTDFYAESYAINVSLKTIANKHAYIINQLADYSNYNFNILDNLLQESTLKSNNWVIKKIYSDETEKTDELIFDIIDPQGLSNIDAKIIQLREHENVKGISFIGSGIKALNAGLQFFKGLSAHASWKEYLHSGTNKTLSTDLLERIKELEAGKKQLEESMNQLKNLFS